MLRIVAALAVMKGVCVALDPEHDLFRPISMYQTPEYAYLGTTFVAALAIASALTLRRLFRRPDAEELIGPLLCLLALTTWLFLLVLADLRYGAFHLMIAVSCLAGYAAYLFYVGRVFREVPLQVAATVMLLLCAVPVVHAPTFGVIENVLVALHCAAFCYFYYVTLAPPSSRRPPPG